MVEKTRHRKIPEIVSWSETVACKGANLRISYDAQNRRVYRKADEDQSGSQETELYYVLDGNRVIEERVYSDEDLKRDYWYGVYIDEPVFARADKNDDNDFADTGEQFYYLHNTQYSVHAIIDTSGSIIEVYKNYQPYGAVSIYTGDGGDSDWWDGDETTGSLSGNYYLFTGRRYDPEADLMFYRNRMYSTSRGRFLQRDPIGYKDGMNLYRAYFVPNSLDPFGYVDGYVDETFGDLVSDKVEEDNSPLGDYQSLPIDSNLIPDSYDTREIKYRQDIITGLEKIRIYGRVEKDCECDKLSVRCRGDCKLEYRRVDTYRKETVLDYSWQTNTHDPRLIFVSSGWELINQGALTFTYRNIIEQGFTKEQRTIPSGCSERDYNELSSKCYSNLREQCVKAATENSLHVLNTTSQSW